MNNLKYWLGFSKIYSIGSVQIRRLLEYFGAIEHCWHVTTADLIEIGGVSSKAIEKFQEEKKKIDSPEKIEEEILKRDIKVITWEDEDYPYYLRQIYDPPMVIFVKGDLKRCNPEKSLAIVGSRRASHYIKEILKKIINELKGSNITIVSGMAAGVDSCAHKAAIDNNLSTIAVMGSGFDHIYPAQNKDLFNKIADEHGAVISESYPDVQPRPYLFPRRNRIISGLSKGTLVAEAGLKSGALITASLTTDQGRELMCIPGNVTNPNTEGIHKLIKEGAAVVTRAQDILEHLNWENTGINEDKKNNKELKLLDNERKIYEILNLEPMSFDDLANKSDLTTDELMSTLTTMELNGIIKQMPGQNFVKNIN